MTEKDVTAALLAPFPPQAIKTRQGGGNRALAYVEGHTVIRRLIDATGNRFDVRVLEMKSVPAGPNTTLFTATVELCVEGLGCRQHIGVQSVNERGGEDLVKGAVTDALKKAATLFGVGLDLYGPDYEAGEIAAPPKQAPRRNAAGDLGPPPPMRQGSMSELEMLAAGYRERLEAARSRADVEAIATDIAASSLPKGPERDGLVDVYTRRLKAFAATA